MFTTNKYETQKYDTILSDDDFEIRFYHTSLKAKVVSNGGANSNFYKLFRFISGNNSNGEKIASAKMRIMRQYLPMTGQQDPNEDPSRNYYERMILELEQANKILRQSLTTQNSTLKATT